MRILVNDIAASKTGALAILLDFYEYVRQNGKDHEWIFLTGIDCIKNPPEHIKVRVMDQVKRSQKDRLYFDLVSGSKFIENLEPDVILSLQNTLTSGKIYRRRDLVINGRVAARKGDRVWQVLYVHQPLGFQKDKRFSFIKSEEREYAIYQYLIGGMIDASVKRADKVIVQTEWMRRAVHEKTGKPLDKIMKVLPDVGDLSSHRPEKISDSWNCKNFFFPSGEILYKNHECVLKAAAILNDRGYTDFKVHFTLKGLSDVTKRHYDDAYNNISWTGSMKRSSVLEEYSTATLLFPSYIETFGVPMAEARQIGTLILASDCPFSREVLEGYENVRFFDPFDEGQLADLMEKVLKGELSPKDEFVKAESIQEESSYSKILKILETIVECENEGKQ